MADKAEPGVDAQITFKVKTSSDIIHTMTMNETTTVLDLKTKLAGQDFENIPVDRQRLIYSGRVMKNDDALAAYKIKPNNTIHMVKSAASNPSQPSSTSAPAPQAVPSNMASGTANNPLASLTGARYAGHQINLPNMEMFGPDGGMGPPMSEERLQQMMSDPNIQQAMREALNNPDFVNSLIDSNPMLRNMPGARELINSPGVQQLMSNPSLLQNAMRLQRMMGGAGNTVFPAPGTTDTNPGSGNGSSSDSGNAQQNPSINPAILPGLMMGGGAGQGTDMQNTLQFVHRAVRDMETAAALSAAASNTPREDSRDGQEPAQSPGHRNPSSSDNPFAALFPAQADNPLGMSNETMQQMMMQIMGQSAPAPPPPDNRPPEDRYAEQLRQLNDMGFCDFSRNVAALRQSGGSVQGAIEHLLSATD